MRTLLQYIDDCPKCGTEQISLKRDDVGVVCDKCIEQARELADADEKRSVIIGAVINDIKVTDKWLSHVSYIELDGGDGNLIILTPGRHAINVSIINKDEYLKGRDDGLTET